ncbi:MAG: transcriptional repressor [Proteobacteria bacterium]|nr:transcriptional repressor [Pseudomonadota bacterium]
MTSKGIKDVGLKVTIPRMAILDFLTENPSGHYSAEDLYGEMKLAKHDIGIATIYRVLNQFETAGLVIKHQFENNQAVYELNTGEHHDHMVDVVTGNIVEFYVPELEAIQEKIAKDHGFELVDHKMILYVKEI